MALIPDPQYNPEHFVTGSAQTDISNKIPKIFGYSSGRGARIPADPAHPAIPGHTEAQMSTAGYFGSFLPFRTGPMTPPPSGGATAGVTNNDNYGTQSIGKQAPPGSLILIFTADQTPATHSYQWAIVDSVIANPLVPNTPPVHVATSNNTWI